MSESLSAEDIARITRGVLEKLDGRPVAARELTGALKAAMQQERPDAGGAGARPEAEAAALQAPAARAEAPPRPVPAAAGSGEAKTRIIVASFGLNRPGIVAAISAVLAENLCSIEDMSQKIMHEFYTLIMIVDISACKPDFAQLSERLKTVEEKLGVTIFVQHEDVFRYMHRV